MDHSPGLVGLSFVEFLPPGMQEVMCPYQIDFELVEELLVDYLWSVVWVVNFPFEGLC